MTDIPNHCHEHGCSFLVMCAKTSLCVCYLHIGRPFLLCSTQHINYVLFMFNLFIIKLKSTEQSSLFFFAVVLGLLMWVLTTACTLWSSRFRSVPFPGPYTLTQVTKFLRLLELIVCFLASFPSNEKNKNYIISCCDETIYQSKWHFILFYAAHMPTVISREWTLKLYCNVLFESCFCCLL